MPLDGQHFDGTVGELLAAFARRTYPRDTAKAVARAWDLDPSTAANVVKAHASERTISKALKAEGWPLLMALGEALTGQSYEAHLQRMIEETDSARQRIASRRDRIRSLEALAASRVEVADRMAP